MIDRRDFMAITENRQDKIRQLASQINNQLDGYLVDIKKLIDFHKFRGQMEEKYSVRNCALIESQFNGAIKVAGYNAWIKEGYHVRKGQKALTILAPHVWKMVTTLDGKAIVPLSKADSTIKNQLKNNQLKTEDKVTYHTASVFDIHQTNCPIEEYPEFIKQFYLMGQTDKFTELFSAIEHYRENNNIKRWVERPDVEQGSEKGFYVPSQNSIWVDPNLDQKQFIKTNLHELAHAKLHAKSQLSAGLKEYQAELTAGIIANYFGLGATEVSTAYINNHIGRMSIVDKEKLVEEVLSLANEVIDTMENHLEKEFGLTNSMGKEINDIIALNESEDISNEISNTVIDLLEQDKDSDGLIDRLDINDQDSRVMTVGDLDNESKKLSKSKLSLNNRINDILEKKRPEFQQDRDQNSYHR